ncbi:MAG: amidase [Alphaproteobacteria bacterium]|jgi:aspartyl-tRNA(Asn)/glutamyl-tRNA(Gln) amidotransferase subunit A|nr:amidase [Alphaproteobacteria bacterium]
MTDLPFLPLTEAATLVAAKQLSPVEYTEALLRRIETHDSRLASFLHLTADAAIAAAREAEAAVQAGATLGPLHGIPFGLKDIIDAEGLATTAHSKILADNVAAEDAEATARLKAAGGILLGKLATHEFALGGPCFDLPWPPARNPWDPSKHPGGSSSGSGVAVAAGFLPAALGSDTGGSVRNPASSCGLVGMKATYGRVSRRGVVPLSFSLDYVGPLTRTVADNAAVLNVIAGHDARDPGSAAVPVPDFTARLDKDIKGLRIGVIRHFYTRDLVADPEMTAAIEAALKTLQGLGAEVREIEARPLRAYAACNRTILLSEAFAVHEQWLKERPEDYGALTRERLLPGAFVPAVDYVQAVRSRRRLKAEFDRLTADLDVVVTASSMEPPCAIDDPEMVAKTYSRQARPPFNVTGNPALVLPTGFSSAGMPLSMQIVGKPFDEATVYQVAQAYEQASPWKDRHPEL